MSFAALYMATKDGSSDVFTRDDEHRLNALKRKKRRDSPAPQQGPWGGTVSPRASSATAASAGDYDYISDEEQRELVQLEARYDAFIKAGLANLNKMAESDRNQMRHVGGITRRAARVAESATQLFISATRTVRGGVARVREPTSKTRTTVRMLLVLIGLVSSTLLASVIVNTVAAGSSQSDAIDRSTAEVTPSLPPAVPLSSPSPVGGADIAPPTPAPQVAAPEEGEDKPKTSQLAWLLKYVHYVSHLAEYLLAVTAGLVSGLQCSGLGVGRRACLLSPALMLSVIAGFNIYQLSGCAAEETSGWWSSGTLKWPEGICVPFFASDVLLLALSLDLVIWRPKDQQQQPVLATSGVGSDMSREQTLL